MRRIDVARRFTSGFGIATECGWGRRAPSTLDELLRIHRELSLPVHDASVASHRFEWPAGFSRIPDKAWTHQPVDTFGLHYDTVENHGWYKNLDPTVEDLARHLTGGQVLVDYSGGTGILLDRLKLRVFDRRFGVVIVDSSPKFLRVALGKFHDDDRVAFRSLRWLKEDKRLQRLEEVLGPELLSRGVDAIASTNAIHLYLDLPGTLVSWAHVLRPGGRVFVQSGNIRNPGAKPAEWVLDETVWAIHEVAVGLVRNDARYAAYRPALDDEAQMEAWLAYRDRVFVPVRPLDYYLRCLHDAGFVVETATARGIEARVDDWFEFLSAYHDAVLGWVGGISKVEGSTATPEAVRDRLALIRHAMDTLFGGRPSYSLLLDIRQRRTRLKQVDNGVTMRVTHRGLLVSPLFHRLPTRAMSAPLEREGSEWKRCNGQPLTCWRGSRRPNRLHTTGWRLTNRQQLVERFTVAELAALARFYSTPEGCRWCARARLYCGRYSDVRARGGGLGADYRSGVGALIGAAVGNRAPCRWGWPPAELLARASASPGCRSRRSSGGSSREPPA